MARLIFPNGEDRLVYETATTPNQPLKNFIGLQLLIYTDEACTQIADIRNFDGSPNLTSMLVVGTDSQIPLFQGPDASPFGADTLFVRPSGATGNGQRIHSRYDDRIDSKLDNTATAADSNRLGGISAPLYSTTTQANAAYVAQTLVDAKGDLLAGSADNTVVRLPVGANGLALVADSTAPAGVKWGSLASLLTRVQHNPETTVNIATTSTTPVDVDATNLAVTFTFPASGAVLVRLTAAHYASVVVTHSWGLLNGTTAIQSRGSDANSSQAVERAATLLVTGTAGATVTYKWSQHTASGTVTTRYGGVYGAAIMEVWAA